MGLKLGLRFEVERPHDERIDLALAQELGELGDEAALGYIGLQARSLESLGTRPPWRMARQ